MAEASKNNIRVETCPRECHEHVKRIAGNTGCKRSVPGCIRVQRVQLQQTRCNLVPHHGSLNASYDFWHLGYQMNQMSRMQV